VVTTHLQSFSEEKLRALEQAAKGSGSADIEVDGRTFSIPEALMTCETVKSTQHVETFVPSVVEPSFGIDRILTAIYEHSFYTREPEAKEAPPAEEAKGKKKKDEKKEAVPGVLGLPAEIAPYKVVILPLQLNIIKDHNAAYSSAMDTLRNQLSNLGLQYKVDDTGASIGKRYARSDELGIPYAATIDFDTLGVGEEADASLTGTVTLRDRDSTDQVRVPLTELPETLSKLSSAHPLTFSDLMAAMGTSAVKKPATEAEGAAGMIEYLTAHGIPAKLNSAVNALGKAKPADPIAFLVAELQK